jgi:hypothetical protein
MLFKNSVRTSKRTQHFTITKINWLTLFKEIKPLFKNLCQNFSVFPNYVYSETKERHYSFHSKLLVTKTEQFIGLASGGVKSVCFLDGWPWSGQVLSVIEHFRLNCQTSPLETWTECIISNIQNNYCRLPPTDLNHIHRTLFGDTNVARFCEIKPYKEVHCFFSHCEMMFISRLWVTVRSLSET